MNSDNQRRIIGVRLPMLRKHAKSISGTEDTSKHLLELPHKFIEEKRLPSWVHNKTIQKAVESYRIEADKKAILKSYRI